MYISYTVIASAAKQPITHHRNVSHCERSEATHYSPTKCIFLTPSLRAKRSNPSLPTTM